VSDLRNAQVRLQQTLRDLASGASTGPAALPIAPFRGDLPWPADGKVERKGRAALPGGTPAEGIEIAASEGAPVVAVHDGSVAFAGSFSGFGNLVILDHGSRSFTLYGDLLDLAVSQGDRVDRGQRLGSVGTLPAGPAGLYFEIRIDGRPVDPLQWLTSP
jgi:septal ring factor EnvC (AmiA/AmiB activator)